ncbi:pentapeptide repeat-containing protein [Bacteroidota bacterium]
MKNLVYFFVTALFIPAVLLAQSVNAGDIIKQIDEGQSVKYENVTITGDLDFTRINDSDNDRSKRKKRSWVDRIVSFGHNGSNEVLYYVEVPVEFINCTFEGGVIAYYHDDYEELTHNVVFFEDVVFKGCEFSDASEFKYVRFEKNADFSNNVFREEALFKYAEFSEPISFAGSKFYDDANFKYTSFDEYVDMSTTYFKREANFKYTDFPYGVSYENAVFDGNANFKYASFDEPSNLDGVEFNDDVDFKYTDYEGNSIIKYLIKSRK